MKTILHIFAKDVRGLSRNLFALIIAIGLCIIPSLYAWFNIYSNWDPYANTSKIQVAVISEDEGYTQGNGTTVNMGDQIKEELEHNDKIGWVFPENKDAAMDGLRSGKYYAAIVIGEDFSFSLYDFLSNGCNHPSITYYENSKKNAVANKITDTGTSSLQQNINTEFVEVVVKTAISDLNTLSSDDFQVIDSLISDITGIQSNLNSYSSTIDTFITSNEQLSENLLKVYNLIPDVQNALNESIDTANLADTTISDTIDNLNDKLGATMNTLTSVSLDVVTHLSNVADKVDVDAEGAANEIKEAANDLDTLIQENNNLEDVLNNIGSIEDIDPDLIASINDQLEAAKTIAELAKDMIEESKQVINDAPELIHDKYESIKDVLNNCAEKIHTVNDIYANNIYPSILSLQSNIHASFDHVTTSLSEATNGLNGVGQLLLSTSNMIDSSNLSLTETQGIIQRLSTRIDTVTGKLNDLNESTGYDTLLSLINADAETYSQFLSEPVKVTQVNVYDATNYGTAVTPFYTTLALWVGAIILVALIKTHVDTEDEIIKNAKPHQKYLGRLILFLLMGQLQAVIVVFGNLYVFHVQCLHPGLFFLAAAVASFVFTLLIYTLTLSFGDLGKALAVVMVVIQIAGSSGTYPIELLPDFFKTVYLYFPFPYSINAMREAISGLYHNDYFVYLVQLSIFAIGALLLGLLIRLPFVELNKFFEKRMKDTDLM